eukprot:TRINITY_DN13456_c0_g1_i3.p1 TRINITY_DN13456_c0_g1~~TRINITY_DN13456_c0_g1_i3.p1  ORF type:complete len:669 (+),score=154.96 TRINITY_DN13456_c0_g1_i3:70-2076(+)
MSRRADPLGSGLQTFLLGDRGASPPPGDDPLALSASHGRLGGSSVGVAFAPCIGIDLGTTNSCVAVWTGTSACVLRSFQHSSTLIPSMVGFQLDQETGEVRELVGHAAYRQWSRNPTATIFSSKRWMGQPDGVVSADDYPFSVVRGPQGLAAFDIPGLPEPMLPEVLGSKILTHLREIACTEHIRGDVRDAVITVPAYFNDAQREATKRAGHRAGLNVLDVLNEPTAAALACGLHDVRQRPGANLWCRKNMLVFDLGGGTFDVTVMALAQKKFDVLSVGGERLGGDDVDLLLLNYFREDIAKRFMDVPRQIDQDGVERVKVTDAERVRFLQRCREVKEALSASPQQQFEMDIAGLSYTAKLSASKMNSLCRTLLRRIMQIVEDVLADSGLEKADIDDVVLVGGSTRMAKIEQQLTKFFSGCKAFVVKTVNPDEVVAEGAVIKAASLCPPCRIPPPVLPVITDVIAQTVGIALAGDAYSRVITRNTPIPPDGNLEKNCLYRTMEDGQTMIEFHVFQGEHPRASQNFYLGTCRIEGLPPDRQRGTVDICVSFSFDQMGILSIVAWVQGMGHLQTRMEVTDAVYSEQTAERYVPNFSSDGQAVAAQGGVPDGAGQPMAGLFMDDVPRDEEDRLLDQTRQAQEKEARERERMLRRRQRELEKQREAMKSVAS